MTPDQSKAARDLLAFYVEAGVLDLVGETPVDRFADPAPAVAEEPGAREAASPDGVKKRDSLSSRNAPPRDAPALPHIEARPAPPAPLPAPLAPEVAVMAAREAAAQAQSLDELRDILSRFQGCALRNTAKQLVFADGNPEARVMFVGEAPGREEDIAGLPFVGPSGQLLDRMLAAIGLSREAAYIANVIPWRPPGNRTPTPQETAICLPFITRQIALADPDVLVCMGGPASQILLNLKDGIRKTRGRWLTYHTGVREIRALPTFHPAYLLRSPLEKRSAWRDMLAIKKALG
jgi:DNA polymerase